MRCYTQEEIAEKEGVDRSTISKIIEELGNLGNLAENHEIAANHLTDFKRPTHNVWKWQTKTGGPKHYAKLLIFESTVKVFAGLY